MKRFIGIALISALAITINLGCSETNLNHPSVQIDVFADQYCKQYQSSARVSCSSFPERVSLTGLLRTRDEACSIKTCDRNGRNCYECSGKLMLMGNFIIFPLEGRVPQCKEANRKMKCGELIVGRKYNVIGEIQASDDGASFIKVKKIRIIQEIDKNAPVINEKLFLLSQRVGGSKSCKTDKDCIAWTYCPSAGMGSCISANGFPPLMSEDENCWTEQEPELSIHNCKCKDGKCSGVLIDNRNGRLRDPETLQYLEEKD